MSKTDSATVEQYMSHLIELRRDESACYVELRAIQDSIEWTERKLADMSAEEGE